MSSLTLGKIRGLQAIASRDGLFTILALDQRGSVLKALGLAEDSPAAYPTMRDFKLATLEHLIAYSSAALLDPEYVAAEAVANGTLPADKGLIVSLEKSGYHGESTARLQALLPDWSVAKVKAMGASAAKLYFDYHPDGGEITAQQEQLVASVVAEGRAFDIPTLIEPVSYSIEPGVPKSSAEFAARRPEIVIETARRIGALGVDVLKMEFPHDASFNDDKSAWEEACAALNDAAPVPWALLSAGVSYDIFKRQVKVACRAGASGFVAGRAIWKEALMLQGAERDSFLTTTAAVRMQELGEIVHRYARPWTAYYPDMSASVAEGWMTHYQASRGAV